MEPDDIGSSERAFEEKVKAGFADVLKREAAVHPQPELRRRILRFLARNPIGTLATCSDNVPRSTPVRFRCDEQLLFYILTEGGGKLQNIRKNPNVSFSVYGRYTGFRSCRGMQLWGKAEIIESGDRDNYLAAYRCMGLEQREDLQKIEMKQPPSEMPIIRISPERIRYLSIPEGILNQELILPG